MVEWLNAHGAALFGALVSLVFINDWRDLRRVACSVGAGLGSAIYIAPFVVSHYLAEASEAESTALVSFSLGVTGLMLIEAAAALIGRLKQDPIGLAAKLTGRK